jgi:hypothetical protein
MELLEAVGKDPRPWQVVELRPLWPTLAPGTFLHHCSDQGRPAGFEIGVRLSSFKRHDPTWEKLKGEEGDPGLMTG